MNKLINVCYVDDRQEIDLSKYLKEFCDNNTEDVTYHEYTFEGGSYDDLLKQDKIRLSDIIIIDSKLFVDSTVDGQKLTGEQFKLILRKSFPYKKTIVISQNEIEPDSTTISKYKSSAEMANYTSSLAYYDEFLGEQIDIYITEIFEFRKQVERLEKNSEIDKVLVEQIDRNINSFDSELPIKKEDIDQLISLFKEAESYYEK